MTAVLEVTDLRVSFGGPPVVRGLGYAVRKGEVLALVGESGCGKSVSAAAVMGLLPRTARVTGSVRLHGRELLGLRERELAAVRGRAVSMIFQDPLSALTPVHRVGDQIAEAVRAHRKVTKEQAAVRAVDLLDLVGIPDPARRALSYPHEFSGGMRQRVLIAMAMANDPDVIICDEPTTALDVTVQAQVLEVLRTAQRRTGAGIVIITHDLGLVAGFADRVLVMYAGRPVEAGDVDDVFYHARMPYTAALLGAVPRADAAGPVAPAPIDGAPPSPGELPPGCPFAPRCPLRVEACDEREPPLFEVGPGHRAACIRWDEVSPPRPAPARPAGPVTRGPRTVLAVDGLVRHYPVAKGLFRRRAGVTRAVDGVSFDIREGETLGLVGESGSGKTTTLTEILELTRPQQGRITVLGRDTAVLTPAQRTAIRREMQVVFQDPLASLDPRMTVHDILAEPLRTHRVTPRPATGELLALVGLDPAYAARYPHHLSGGQRQRVAIARALALRPRLLVLDEPVSALDVSVQAGVLALLASLKAELGLSYLLVAHDLAVVRHVADRVAVMHLGRIAEIGQAGAVYAAPAHPYTRALLSAAPLPDPARERARERIVLTGERAAPPGGCRFRTRCPTYRSVLTEAERGLCAATEPGMRALGEDQFAACHYAERLAVV